VLDIVVQSAVGYTLSLLVMGVYDVLPLTDDPRKLILNDDIVDNMGEICTVLIVRIHFVKWNLDSLLICVSFIRV